MTPVASNGALMDASITSAAPTSACGRAELNIKRAIPTVWLMIDGSGSMSAGLMGVGGPSRWALLRQALLDQNGVVARLQASVSFGLMIYDGGLSAPGVYVPGICPRLITVPPALNNFMAIQGAYPQAETGASTPTHYALEELSKQIIAKPNPSGPAYVLLATDGKPNLCDFHDGVPSSNEMENQAINTVRSLANKGTKTFAISLAGGDAELQAHLEAVATAGSTGQRAFSPNSKDALVQALTSIVGGTTSCEVQLEGTVIAGKECAGEVKLNDTLLNCDDNGYQIKADHKTLTLMGAACRKLQGEPTAVLKASFACADVVLN